QPAHEIQLDLPPTGAKRGGDGADEVLFGHHLVDHPADPFGAAFGGEGQPGATAVTGDLVGEVDIEGVHPGRGQAQAGAGTLVAVGQTFGDLADLRVVG